MMDGDVAGDGGGSGKGFKRHLRSRFFAVLFGLTFFDNLAAHITFHQNASSSCSISGLT